MNYMKGDPQDIWSSLGTTAPFNYYYNFKNFFKEHYYNHLLQNSQYFSNMSNPCELPPCPPCPPPPPPPCPQVCPPAPPAPVCRVKPIMRGLHWAQTKRIIAQAFIFAATGGASYYFFIAAPRRAAYADFHAWVQLSCL